MIGQAVVTTIAEFTANGDSAIHVLGKAASPGTEEIYSLQVVIQISGTFDATLKIQGSLDNTNYQDWICNITEAGIYILETAPLYLKANCADYVSGTATVKIQKLVKGF